MIEIVREIIVKPEHQGQFELLFGPGGAWGKLFGSSAGFRGTTMLNDTQNLRRYLIIAFWDTAVQQEQARQALGEEYAKLNADLEHWTEAIVEVGIFRARAEATVRPRAKASGRNRRSSR